MYVEYEKWEWKMERNVLNLNPGQPGISYSWSLYVVQKAEERFPELHVLS